MKPEFDLIPVNRNVEAKRFELRVDGYTAFIDFKEGKDFIALIHTESPKALAGRGVATALIEKTLEYLEKNNYALVPLCPLVIDYIKRHTEWLRIVREDFKSKFF